MTRYAMAYGVKGFGRSKMIRVRVERVEGEYVWCRTASVKDAGTPLVLNVSQIVYEEDEPEDAPLRHKDGLVSLG